MVVIDPGRRHPAAPHPLLGTFRQKDDPKRSPAIAALEAVLDEGRAARIPVIYDGPATVGGRLIPGAREQFSTVILARVSVGMWQLLAPIVDPALKSVSLPGRVHVVQDGTGHVAQVPLMTDAEVADWLTATEARGI
ncbi:hypothetical protein [Streptomyces tuirus]